MNNRRGWNRFEWLLLVSAVGLVMLVGISRYIDLAREGRKVGFEVLAHNFTAAVSLTRAQWILQNAAEGRHEYLHADKTVIYFNSSGWPFAAEVISDAKPSNGNDAVNCLQLWEILLQNSEAATVEGQSARGERRYHITSLNDHGCRYELVTKNLNSHFFDYDSQTGRVRLSVPAYKSISTL